MLSSCNVFNAILVILTHAFSPNNYHYVHFTDQETISEQDVELGAQPSGRFPGVTFLITMKFCFYSVISKAYVESSLAKWQLSQWPRILALLWFCPANWTKWYMWLPELTLQNSKRGIQGALIPHVPRGRQHSEWPWIPRGDTRVSTSVDSWLAVWSTAHLSTPHLP